MKSQEPKGEAMYPPDSPSIFWEDAEFAIVHKPANLLVHPTRPDGASTLLGWLQRQQPNIFWGLVNRLDRETSGLVIAAKSAEAASVFGQLMMRHGIKKEYVAIVQGEVIDDHGTIDAPIQRIGLGPDNLIWVKRGVSQEGQQAITHYHVLERKADRTLLRLIPETGRLHQIRVHLASIGHPVLGDKLYAGPPELYLSMVEKGWNELHDKHFGDVRRQALHAARLEFTWNTETMTFEDPLPEDMKGWFNC